MPSLMRGQHWNGFAILGNGVFCKALILDRRVVDTNYLTCCWAGQARFHDWLDRQIGVEHWAVDSAVLRPARRRGVAQL